MANPQHMELLLGSTSEWNAYRRKTGLTPDFSGADLRKASLTYVDFSNADLRGANLSKALLTRANFAGATLVEASLTGADLREANLCAANLSRANLVGATLKGAYLMRSYLENTNLSGATLTAAHMSGAHLNRATLNRARLIQADLYDASLCNADLTEAILVRADLRLADLSGATLSGANLGQAALVSADLRGTNLVGSMVYGVSVWDVELEGAIQTDLIITPPNQPEISVDNLEVAQFVYLLVNNKKIRDVIETVGKKTVLILGRFTPERKAILDAIRHELRNRDALPLLFDFEKPANRDITETVSTLAHMARFIIADITDARSIQQELMAIVPTLPSVPVQPLLLASQREYGMFEHFRRFPWVLEPFLYEDQNGLLAVLTEKVIGPAEQMARRKTAAVGD